MFDQLVKLNGSPLAVCLDGFAFVLIELGRAEYKGLVALIQCANSQIFNHHEVYSVSNGLKLSRAMTSKKNSRALIRKIDGTNAAQFYS